jgi:hypothetical protein
MIIKKKIDCVHFLVHFVDFAEWDGEKHYIQLPGITLMQYYDGTCTFHRKNDSFVDIKETEFGRDFVWAYRKVINDFLRTKKDIMALPR